MQLVTIWFLIQGMYQCACQSNALSGVCLDPLPPPSSATSPHPWHVGSDEDPPSLPSKGLGLKWRLITAFGSPDRRAACGKSLFHVKQSVPGHVNSCKICFRRISTLLVSCSDNSFWPERTWWQYNLVCAGEGFTNHRVKKMSLVASFFLIKNQKTSVSRFISPDQYEKPRHDVLRCSALRHF